MTYLMATAVPPCGSIYSYMEVHPTTQKGIEISTTGYSFTCIRPTLPFFLNISFIDPHPPLMPPVAYYDRYFHRDLPDPTIGDGVPEFDGSRRVLTSMPGKFALTDTTCAVLTLLITA
ncbi:TPA: hypothetical protein EYO57_24585 [Candidatus Poribacteria bacterium]|nr:hypothetical protein [Candidatus Poribacteria bacterium]